MSATVPAKPDQPEKPKRVKVVPVRKNGHLPLSDTRKETFLRVLAETGSYRAACAAACPHLDPKSKSPNRSAPGWVTFQDEMRRDPTFAQAVREALDTAIARAEAAVVDRMNTPTRRPVVANGAIVGQVEEWRDANNLLLRFLERHSPEWMPRKGLDAKVQHQHELGSGAPGGAGFLVRAQDVALLEPAEQRVLAELLVRVDELRKEAESGSEPNQSAALPAGDQDAGRHGDLQ